jgi:NADPH:quinone reductase-like Zn-dependent oxidoreductase
MKLKKILKWTALAVLVGLVVLFQFAYWTSKSDYDRVTAAQGERMKAIVYSDYGGPEVLKLAEIAKPIPKDNQALVRVHAVSVNPYDWHFIRGQPLVMRLGIGLRKPTSCRLGIDFAGTVEAVGKDVKDFKPGDEVWGGKPGAFAEYVAVSEKSIARKPGNISFEQAASAPIAGLTALQAVRDKASGHAGQKILINGASGGVGTFAVQVAKSFGAEVTGVCSTRNVELVRSLGADRVIDYTKEDFMQGAERYDVIIDNVGNQPMLSLRRALVPDGKYIMVGGGWVQDQGVLGPMVRPIKALFLKPFVRQQMGMMMTDPTQNDYNTFAELMASAKVTPVIDRTYRFEELPAAIRYIEEGHARGKVVIAVQ